MSLLVAKIAVQHVKTVPAAVLLTDLTEKCLQLLAHLAARARRFLSSQEKTDLYIAATVSQKKDSTKN